jgi:hypothetical protein
MTTPSMSKIRAALVVAAVALASQSPVLHAQDQTLRSQVNVPFAFEVGSVRFAPGAYTLASPREHVLSIQGPSGTALAMNQRETSLSPATESKVVFYRYGDRYFLREVWVKGETDHLRCSESKAEHRVRNIQRAANHASIAAPTNVEIALLENPR